MQPIAFVFLIILIAVIAMLLGSVYMEPLTSAIRRRIPSFDYEADTLLLWGLLGISGLGGLLLVAYLLTRP